MTYEFIAVDATSATVALQWEKKQIPFTVSFDVPEIVLEDISNKLRDQTGFNRQAWEQAAQYALANGKHEQALDWINNAQAGWFFSEKNFGNASIKAAALEQLGRSADADAEMESVFDQATVLELHQYGRQLIAQGKQQRALEVFQTNAAKNKGVWPTNYGLARGYSAIGDSKTALKHLKKALANAPNEASKDRVAANITKLENGESIN